MNIRSVSYFLVFSLALTAVAAYNQQPVSGYDYLSPEMQAMQDDDFANPGMITVEAGESLFAKQGKDGKSCASCHGNGANRFDTKRIAAYPLYNKQLKKPVTLRGQILSCWNERIGAQPLKYSSEEALQLEAFVRRLAYGETVTVDVSGRMSSYYEAGKKLYRTRWGQVDIACYQCHDYHAGQTFRGQKLTQGQSNGFPVYRHTEGQVVGLQERITQCLTNLRAEPHPLNSKEYIDLEVYMNARSNGLKIETPGIRY